MPKAYSYVRFSTLEQAKGNSLERQTELARRYAKDNGLELDLETYYDEGVSSWNGANKDGALGAFLEGIKHGFIEKGSYLIVESLDRISRQNPRRAARTIEDICESGINVVSVLDNRVYTDAGLDDPFTFIMLVLGFTRAHEESQKKSDRHRDNWSRKRDKAMSSGEAMTRRCPAWLCVDADKRFVVNEHRAAVVREIFELHLGGVGQHSLAVMLNERQEPVWGPGKSAAQFWRKSYISKILNNPAVIGEFTPHNLRKQSGKKTGLRTPLDTLPGYYPAIVDEAAFYKVQELHSGAKLRGKKGKAAVQFYLSRLAVCPYCGSFMTRINKGKNWIYLVCTRAKNKAKCIYRAIPQSVIEDAVLKSVLRSVPSRDGGVAGIEERIEQHKAELAKVGEELNNLVEIIKSGERKKDEVLYEADGWRYLLQHELDALAAKKRDIEDSIKDLNRQRYSASPDRVREIGRELREAVDEDRENYERINNILLRLVSSVEVRYNQERLVIHFHHTDKMRVVPLPGYKKEIDFDTSDEATGADEELGQELLTVM